MHEAGASGEMDVWCWILAASTEMAKEEVEKVGTPEGSVEVKIKVEPSTKG